LESGSWRRTGNAVEQPKFAARRDRALAVCGHFTPVSHQ